MKTKHNYKVIIISPKSGRKVNKHFVFEEDAIFKANEMRRKGYVAYIIDINNKAGQQVIGVILGGTCRQPGSLKLKP